MNQDRKFLKIPYISILPMAIILMFTYKFVDKIADVKNFIDLLIRVITPFIWGFAIAYLVNPLMEWLEKNFNLKRWIAIMILYLIIIGVLLGAVAFVLPSMIASITDIISNFPTYLDKLEEFGIEMVKKFEQIYGNNIETALDSENMKKYIDGLGQMLNNGLSNFLIGLVQFSSGFLKFIMGLIISVYMLKDKEKFINGSKKIVSATFSKKNAEEIFIFMIEVDRIFSRYISGKMLDSLIIGIIAFIGFYIMRAPYVMLLSIIIGATNMIPYFGPFIGGIPVVIIVLLHNPITAVWATIFILVLQQFDGLVLGPKILGGSVGISPFWIILAITIGGGLFGLIGMLIGVPILVIILNLINRKIDKKLIEKTTINN